MEINTENLFDIKTTVFFKRISGELNQKAIIKIFLDDPADKVDIILENKKWKKKYSINTKEINNNRADIYIPEVKGNLASRASLAINNEIVSIKEIILLARRKWEVYLHPFSHLDPGYTDLPSRVMEKMRNDFNYIIDYCSETNDLDDDSKYRWNIESGYWLEKALEPLGSKSIEKVRDLIRNRRIEITPFYEPHISEFSDDETLIRSMYFCFKFARECGVKIESAMATDIPSVPWSIPQILVKSGIKYLTTAANTVMADYLKLPRPFYWEGQDGSRVLLLDTDDRQHYQEAVMLGFGDNYNQVLKKLPKYLIDLERSDSRFDFDLLALRDPGSLGDNTKPNVNVSYIVEQWNKNWEYPKLRVSIYSEYFKRFEEKYGTYLKTFKGAWPDYWISNSGSAAFETGVNRITHNNKIIAERICTLLKILNSDFKYPGKKIEDIYNKIIIEDRSGWANDVSVLEPDNYKTKGEIAENFSNVYRAAISAGEIIKEVHQDLVDNAANGVDFKQKRYPDRTHNIVVTNILNWKRSDIAEVLIPKRLLGESKKIRIFDPINDKELRSQIKIICPEDNYRERITDFEKVVFFAEDVPAFGLKNFEVIFDDKGSGGNSFGISDNAIENQFYTVRFDPRTGMIENLEDKDSGRDLINHSSKYQFNQLIYENPEEKRDLSWTNPLVKEGKVTISEDIIYLNPIFKEEFGQSYSYPGRDSKIKRISPENQEIIGIRNGEIFSELFTRSSIDCLFPDIISHFILDNCSKRIFLRNFISKVEKMDAEAVYFAFPFNIEKPVFKLNCHNGYFEPEKQQLPGSNRNWYCSQKWVDIYNKETALTWSSIEAPLVEIGDINTSKWLDKLEIDRADLFSYIMNNYWFTAAAAGQGGRNWFNYCFTTKSSTFDPVSSYRFGHSFHYPIIAEFLEDPGKNSGNQLAGLGEYGFIGDIPENIIINGFKKSEKDNSIIIRFLEVKGLSTKFKFNFKVKKIIGAYETTPVEDEIKKAKIENGQIMISIDPYELKTYKLVF